MQIEISNKKAREQLCWFQKIYGSKNISLALYYELVVAEKIAEKAKRDSELAELTLKESKGE